MFRTPPKIWAFLLLAASGCFLGVNCLPPTSQNSPDIKSGGGLLRKFGSEEELRSFLASQATAMYRSNGMDGGFGCAASSADFFPTSMNAGVQADASESRDYSTTNIQEVGVDESDIIKNNGEVIYMLTANKIHVVSAIPADGMSELSTIDIDHYGSSLYLTGDRLVALSGYGYSYAYGSPMPMIWIAGATSSRGDSSPAMETIGGPWRDGGQTTVTILDVSDPANPTVSKSIRFEGDLATSRLIGDKLHLVLTTLPKLPNNPTPQNIASMAIDQWLPQFEEVSPDGTVTSSGSAVGWQNCLYPSDSDGYAFTVVVTVDLADPDAEFRTTAVTANVGTVYASTQALYLTDTQYRNGNDGFRTDTIIHKLEFTDVGTQYVASGFVPGRPLSQYSLGEYQDYLRIATTTEQWSTRGEDLHSDLFVLGVNDTNLEVVGKIENIAPGEKIYSARFMGDRGFLVTFRRIDPLFTLDLADPANPRIVGELKVPGYSDHIQMLDANHLLTIGRDTQDDGNFAWVQGVLLTIFDVSDMADPKILTINGKEAREVIGGRGTSSEANYNPKAFNHYPARKALAFPVDLYGGDTIGAQYGSHSFTGLMVYRVSVENGFEKLGQIASADGGDVRQLLPRLLWSDTRGVHRRSCV